MLTPELLDAYGIRHVMNCHCVSCHETRKLARLRHEATMRRILLGAKK